VVQNEEAALRRGPPLDHRSRTLRPIHSRIVRGGDPLIARSTRLRLSSGRRASAVGSENFAIPPRALASARPMHTLAAVSLALPGFTPADGRPTAEGGHPGRREGASERTTVHGEVGDRRGPARCRKATAGRIRLQSGFIREYRKRRYDPGICS
jgi:hypothetical protein